jgi:hypothetical protein
MSRIVKRLVGLAVVGVVIHRALKMAGIIGEDEVDFEWADDAD